MKRYETVIYLAGDDYDEWEAIMYPEREGVSLGWPDGQDAAFDYLMQWEYGEPTDEYDTPPWGGDEQTHEVDGYVMAWHTGLSHCSLARVTEVEGTDA